MATGSRARCRHQHECSPAMHGLVGARLHSTERMLRRRCGGSKFVGIATCLANSRQTQRASTENRVLRTYSSRGVFWYPDLLLTPSRNLFTSDPGVLLHRDRGRSQAAIDILEASVGDGRYPHNTQTSSSIGAEQMPCVDDWVVAWVVGVPAAGEGETYF